MVAAGLLAVGATDVHAASDPGPSPCRLRGVEHEALCGRLPRPLDPARPDGTRFELHYAVLPAVARHQAPDPVFYVAGGPGQSAIDLAGTVTAMLARFGLRRDIVLVDQRGTGRSAPLHCDDDDPARPLAEQLDPARRDAHLRACFERLATLPHVGGRAGLGHFTTWHAVADLEAVRAALGLEQINLVASSYGTRVALEYLRQHPRRVRRMVLDGVAPPDMALPASIAADAEAALDAVFGACERDAACRTRHPALRAHWAALLAAPPRRVTVPHPWTGLEASIDIDREQLLNLVRQPLYLPMLASALPLAIDDAAAGRWTGLVGLSAALAAPGRGGRVATGMHHAVVCGEDMPRLAAPARGAAPTFGDTLAEPYRRACAGWPATAPVPGWGTLPVAEAPVLLLSGGRDPVTPPRHAQRVADALGPRARHAVVAQAGHGVMALPCMRDVVYRFVDAADAVEAQALDLGCARDVPAPPALRRAGAGEGPP